MPSNRRILVVDDDPHLCMMMTDALGAEGYWVHACTNAMAAMEVLRDEPFDLIVTDIKMPHVSGLDLLRHVRENIEYTRVVVMTAYPSLETAKEAVRGQAFDYLEKPFTLPELRQSVSRALHRRPAADQVDPPIHYGRLTIDRATRSAWIGEERVPLARREYDMLVFLAERRGYPVTYEELLKGVWQTARVDRRTKSWVKTCAHRLRTKLEDDGRGPRTILTVRGVGYQFGN